jgi:hypothetical protein
MNRQQPLPEGVRGGRPDKAAKRAWEHGNPMPASRTPRTTRSRSIPRSLQRQPRAQTVKQAPASKRGAKTSRR